MFLQGFKRNSNQKFINKLLNKREPILSSKKIEFVGIIINLNEFDDFEAFRIFFGDLKINPNKIKIAAYTDDSKLVSSSIELLFSLFIIDYSSTNLIKFFNRYNDWKQIFLLTLKKVSFIFI